MARACHGALACWNIFLCIAWNTLSLPMISWQKLVTSMVMSSKNMVSPSAVPVRTSLRYAGHSRVNCWYVPFSAWVSCEWLWSRRETAFFSRTFTKPIVCFARVSHCRGCFACAWSTSSNWHNLRNTEEDWQHLKRRKDAPNYRFASPNSAYSRRNEVLLNGGSILIETWHAMSNIVPCTMLCLPPENRLCQCTGSTLQIIPVDMVIAIKIQMICSRSHAGLALHVNQVLHLMEYAEI